jgi:hypothetical protein
VAILHAHVPVWLSFLPFSQVRFAAAQGLLGAFAVGNVCHGAHKFHALCLKQLLNQLSVARVVFQRKNPQ